jgi:hypothetical protein
LQKRKAVLLFSVWQNGLIVYLLFAVNLKEAHRKYSYGAAYHQTNEKCQHIVIPSSS